MKILDNYDLCYGCSACYSICPVGAIKMKESEEGFKYPLINQEKCIECKACQKSCPVLNNKFNNTNKPETYALMADDKTRSYASSGGAFPLLAKGILEEGGYVAGAVFREDYSVKHIVSNDPKEIRKMSGSKYLQSDIEDVLKQTKNLLEKNKLVMFTGCPCQIAGLYSYLNKPYDNLLTVDLICHGVPSPMVWQKFLKETAKGRNVKEVNFRYKGLKGWSATTYIAFEEGDTYVKQFVDCNFEKAASSQKCSRLSCKTCQFANTSRQGDITIGDFWGVNKYKREMDDRKGTSIILLNNQKGIDFVAKNNKRYKVNLFEKIPLTHAQKHNSQLYKPPHAHPGREVFIKSISEGEVFERALSKADNENFDVALLGIWYAANYGSAMTNFALYKTVEDLGYKPLFVDIPNMMWKGDTHRSNYSVTRRFGYKHYAISKKYESRADLKNLNRKCDTFLVGSDQIWNYKLCASAGKFFYLDFAESGKKKIAYGTSFGHERFSGSELDKSMVATYLNRFDAVSVREEYAVDMAKELFDINTVQMPDPVFLCDKAHYTSIIKESKSTKDSLVAYILDPNEEKQNAIKHLAEKLNLNPIILPNAVVKEDMRKNWKMKIEEGIDVEEWLGHFSKAKFVLTDSFHGTCFALIFNKPFISIKNNRRGPGRFSELLKIYDLEDKVVDNAKVIIDNESLLNNIDFAKVNSTMQIERERGLNWLKKALSAKTSKLAISEAEIVDYRIDALEAKITKLFDVKNFEAINTKFAEQMKINNAKIEEIKKKNVEIENKNKQIEGILNSSSFKIGRAITWLPRQIKKLFKGKE